MERFCSQCGAALQPGAQFCGNCGTPVMQQPQKPQAIPYRQPARQPQKPVKQPKQAKPAKQQGKKGKGLLIAIIAGAVVLALGVTAFFGFREGGFLRGAGSQSGPAAAAQTDTNTAAMLDYARRLEEMGNYEAAARIYEMLPDAARADMESAVEAYRDDPRRLVLDALTGEDLTGALTGETEVPETEPPETEPPETTPPEIETVMTFTDVEEGAYYYRPVLWALSKGIVSGETFSPTDDCTRAQTLTFLWRAKGKPTPGITETPYTDVPEGSFYHQPVLWAYENGLIAASADGLFHPDDAATRAQAVTFLYRAEGAPLQNFTPVFDDVPENAYYALPATWAAQEGLISSDSSFKPDSACTRAVFVTLLYRLYANEG